MDGSLINFRGSLFGRGTYKKDNETLETTIRKREHSITIKNFHLLYGFNLLLQKTQSPASR